MKPNLYLLIGALSCPAPLAYGQVLPNTVLADGLAGFSTDMEDLFGYRAAADAGVLVSSTLMLGARLEQAQLFYLEDAPNAPILTDNSLALYGRKYFPGQSALAFFLELETGYRRTHSPNADPGDEWSSLTVAAGAGGHWRFSTTAAFELALQLRYFSAADVPDRLLLDVFSRFRLLLPPERKSANEAPASLTTQTWMLGGAGQMGWGLDDAGSSSFQMDLRAIVGRRASRWIWLGARLEAAAATALPTQYHFLPFARGYITPDHRFKIFGEGGLGPGVAVGVGQLDPSLRSRFGAGLTHFLTKDLAVDTFFGYQGASFPAVGGGWSGRLIGEIELRVFQSAGLN